MKNLILVIPIVLLFNTMNAQEIAIASNQTSSSAILAENAPVESYWLTQSLEPLNYQHVLQGISYDARALEAGLEGTVVLMIQVDENGHYFDHEVLEESHPILVQAVEEKVHQLEFPKPEYQGASVSALVMVPFRFRLTDGW